MEFYNTWDSFIGQKVEKSQKWECDNIEKAVRDRSHLTQKVVTDKNGKQRKVWVKMNPSDKKQLSKIKQDYKEMYSEAHELKRNIKAENTVSTLSEKVKFTPEQMEVISTVYSTGDYDKNGAKKLLNDLASENKEVYSQLTAMNNKIWDSATEKQATFDSLDLVKEKLSNMIANHEIKKKDNVDLYSKLSDQEFIDKYRKEFPSVGRSGTLAGFKSNIQEELNKEEYWGESGSSSYSEYKENFLKELMKRSDAIGKIWNLQ